MTKEEFDESVTRTETTAEITYDVRPSGEKQQEVVASILGELVFRSSLGALNASKKVALLVDNRFENTAQLIQFLNKL